MSISFCSTERVVTRLTIFELCGLPIVNHGEVGVWLIVGVATVCYEEITEVSPEDRPWSTVALNKVPITLSNHFFLEVELHQECSSPRVTHIMSTLFLIPSIMTKPSNDFPKLSPYKHKSILYIITLLMKPLNFKIMFWSSIQKLNSFWCIQTIIHKMNLFLPFLTIFIHNLRLYLVQSNKIITTNKMRKIIML